MSPPNAMATTGGGARCALTALGVGRAPGAHRRTLAAAARGCDLGGRCRWLGSLLGPPPGLATGPLTGPLLAELTGAPATGEPRMPGARGDAGKAPRPGRAEPRWRREDAGDGTPGVTPREAWERPPRRRDRDGGSGRAGRRKRVQPPAPRAAAIPARTAADGRSGRRAPGPLMVDRRADLSLLWALAGERGEPAHDPERAKRPLPPPPAPAAREPAPPDLPAGEGRRWRRELAGRALRALSSRRGAGGAAETADAPELPRAGAPWETPLRGPQAPEPLLRRRDDEAAASSRSSPPPGGELPPSSRRRPASRPYLRPDPVETVEPGAASPALDPPVVRPLRPLPVPTPRTEPPERPEPGAPALDAPGALRPTKLRGIEAAGAAESDLGRLAERMRRILTEEARRHGIDV